MQKTCYLVFEPYSLFADRKRYTIEPISLQEQVRALANSVCNWVVLMLVMISPARATLSWLHHMFGFKIFYSFSNWVSYCIFWLFFFILQPLERRCSLTRGVREREIDLFDLIALKSLVEASYGNGTEFWVPHLKRTFLSDPANKVSQNKWLEIEILFGKTHSRQTLAIEKPQFSDEDSFLITGQGSI